MNKELTYSQHQCLARIDALQKTVDFGITRLPWFTDDRLVSIAVTHLETAFMFLNKAVSVELTVDQHGGAFDSTLETYSEGWIRRCITQSYGPHTKDKYEEYVDCLHPPAEQDYRYVLLLNNGDRYVANPGGTE